MQCAFHSTLEPRSQLSAEEHIGQLALAVALLRCVIFIQVDVIEVNRTCKKQSRARITV